MGNFEGEGGSNTEWRGKAGRRLGVSGDVRRERTGEIWTQRLPLYCCTLECTMPGPVHLSSRLGAERTSCSVVVIVLLIWLGSSDPRSPFSMNLLDQNLGLP